MNLTERDSLKIMLALIGLMVLIIGYKIKRKAGFVFLALGLAFFGVSALV